MSKPTMKKQTNKFLDNPYQYGFHDKENYVYKAKKGLSEDIVKEITSLKNEPEWMRTYRLKALKIFYDKSLPTWGGDLSKIHFDDIYYYIKPTNKSVSSWKELPKEIKRTYDRIGIPEAERKYLAGVKAQYESEVVYGSLLKSLKDKGVLFLSMDQGLAMYPDLVKQYFSTVVPIADNKFASLNSAVWSGGSFIYVPKGVKVDLPLQAYFRINAANMGQFERTLIIADEGSFVHYLEGCFTKDTVISANSSLKPISKIKVGDKVLTHTGEYKRVYHTQKRKYSGDLYTIKYYGDSGRNINVTSEHPFLCVRRRRANERNSVWLASWVPVRELRERDYLLVPIDNTICSRKLYNFEIELGDIKKRFRPMKKQIIPVSLTPEFFRLVGYYLAEGSVDNRGYLRFSFASKERDYIEDVKNLVNKIFNFNKSYEFRYKNRAGTELIFSSVKLARIFAYFGKSAKTKQIPHWMLQEDISKQKGIIVGLFRGDGNYYKKQNKVGLKEIFRINTISETLARQVRDILFRQGIFSFINIRDRKKDSRHTMYTIGITGGFMKDFGELVNKNVSDRINEHKRATKFYLDSKYAYVPIKKITKRKVSNLDVYNFGVEDDESYTASVAVHNCTAPIYSSDSLHSAVVEIIVKRGARVKYTTIQNWSKNVYNLVTKRAKVYEEGIMEWVDCNLGSKLTLKYPSCFLMGRRARGDVLSMAFAGENQVIDSGGKMVHLAPETSGTITSKSLSKNGGRASYRGLVRINKGAFGSKSKVKCDALILDNKSSADTYPHIEIMENDVEATHEAVTGKLNEEQIFYLMSRGIKREEAEALLVNGFIEPLAKELPMEYAIELNRLIGMEMEGSVG